MGYRFGPYRLLPNERRLERDGETIALGSRAFDLLHALVEHGGAVVTKKDLTARAWPDTLVDEVSLRVHMSSLRKLLGDNGSGSPYITNVSGRGYMLAAEAEPDNAASHILMTRAPAGHNNLPPALARMVGRDAAVVEITERLQLHRFVTIVGAGGMGKTTLALAVGHQMIDDFPEGAVFVDLAAVNEPELVATTMASQLGVGVPAHAAVGFICNFLADKRLLLVLDNCEHVVGTVAELAEATFARCPDLSILATSREALKVEGEYVYKISPLDTPAAGTTGSLLRSFPALALFMDRLFAAGGNPALDEAELELAAEICRRLGGMALAIELAAARGATHGVARTLELLDRRFGIHWSGRRTALPRHQTVLALHDWSYNLLNSDEKSVLRRLGWLSGQFTADAASSLVQADVEATLEAMADKSLVARAFDSSDDMKFRLAETTRAFALEKLREDPEETASTARAHAAYLLNLLKERTRRADSLYLGHGASTAIDEIAELRTALTWCFDEGVDLGLGSRLVAHGAQLLLETSLLEECFRWSSRALECLPNALADTLEEALLHQAHAVAGIIVNDKPEAVKASFERALQIARQYEDYRLQISILAGMNIFVMRAGDCYHGSRVADEGEALCHDAEDPQAARLAQWMKGITHSYGGEIDKAAAYLEEGLQGRNPRSLDYNLVVFTQLIRAKVQLARLQLFRGMARRSDLMSVAAIELAKEYKHPIPLCIALAYSAATAIWKDDLIRARALALELADLSRRYTLVAFNAVSRGLEGEVLLREGHTAEAVVLLEDAIAIMKERNHDHMVVSFHGALAEAYAEMGNPSEALRHVEIAIELGNVGGEIFQMPDLLRIRSCILARRALPGDLDAALDGLNASLQLSHSSGCIMYELNAAATLVEVSPSRAASKRLDTVAAKLPDGDVEAYVGRAKSIASRSGGKSSRSLDITAA